MIRLWEALSRLDTEVIMAVAQVSRWLARWVGQTLQEQTLIFAWLVVSVRVWLVPPSLATAVMWLVLPVQLYGLLWDHRQSDDVRVVRLVRPTDEMARLACYAVWLITLLVALVEVRAGQCFLGIGLAAYSTLGLATVLLLSIPRGGNGRRRRRVRAKDERAAWMRPLAEAGV